MWSFSDFAFLCSFLCRCRLVAKSVQHFCDPMDCRLPGSSVHGISQARIPEWVVISFSRGSSWPRVQSCISCIDRQILYHWATWEAPCPFLTQELIVTSFWWPFQAYLLCLTFLHSTVSHHSWHKLSTQSWSIAGPPTPPWLLSCLLFQYLHFDCCLRKAVF